MTIRSPRFPGTGRSRLLAAAIGALLSVSVACKAPPEPSQGAPGSTAQEETSTARVYTTRGIVRGIPTADRPGSELSIRHQAIPDFIDLKGNEVGMGSMTMPFPTADSLSLEGIAPGDPIEFDLAVDWDADRPVEITRLVELPEGTEISFDEDPQQ